MEKAGAFIEFQFLNNSLAVDLVLKIKISWKTKKYSSILCEKLNGTGAFIGYSLESKGV